MAKSTSGMYLTNHLVDEIVYKSRKDIQIVNRCIDSVLGIDMEGHKEILVHQVQNSAKFVAYKDHKAVCADLKKISGGES